MKPIINIFWFRRDLRLEDNCGLFHALNSHNIVLPIFIFDKNILHKLQPDDARVSFIHQELENINHQLSQFDSKLSVFHGNPSDIFKELQEKYTIETVFTNHDYEPYGIHRDLEIEKDLSSNQINLKTYKDQVIL
jgi:deoxyribodipyrimidine photo-lyase